LTAHSKLSRPLPSAEFMSAHFCAHVDRRADAWMMRKRVSLLSTPLAILSPRYRPRGTRNAAKGVLTLHTLGRGVEHRAPSGMAFEAEWPLKRSKNWPILLPATSGRSALTGSDGSGTPSGVGADVAPATPCRNRSETPSKGGVSLFWKRSLGEMEDACEALTTAQPASSAR